jgi:hypothetical protein
MKPVRLLSLASLLVMTACAAPESITHDGGSGAGGTGGSTGSGNGGTNGGDGGTGGSGGTTRSASGTGGRMLTGGAVGTSGTPSGGGGTTVTTGGSSGTGGVAGSTVTTGGSSGAGGVVGPGGSSGGMGAAGGSGGVGSGCPGVPIVPDAKGFLAPGSNSLGIHGSWFEYSDCADLKNVNCSTVATPPANSFPNVAGKMCTSGHTSTAPGAWGAGIALELNDGPPQMPYDTTAHGVIGFCFELSGATIPSTIRVAFPTKDNNDNAYFSAVSTVGQHSVLFSDTAQGSWVTTKSAFEPTAVMLMQFQIPSSPAAEVPWDFCIDGVTAITQ